MKSILWLNAIGFLALLTINFLANALPLGGVTTGEVSQSFDNLFVPAAYTFSIWGLIYLALAIFIAKAFFVPEKHLLKVAVWECHPWIAINFALNMSWLMAWHHLWIGLSTIIMLGILLSLIIIYGRLQRFQLGFKHPAWWLVVAPFSLYLGWICVATIANFAAFGSQLPVAVFERGDLWITGMLIFATAVFGYILWKFRDPVPVLVFIWAVGGIYAKYQSRPDHAEYPMIWMAGICMVLAAALLWMIFLAPNRPTRSLL